MTIRAVIFDLDGVLTDTAEQHFQAWKQLAEEEGLPFDREANEDLRGLSRRDSLLRILGSREVDEARLAALMERKNGYYRQRLAGLTPQDTLPGAREAIEAARRRGWRVAIGSSSRNARTVLDRLGLTDQFDAIADGNTTERAKPAPDLFLAAAEALGVAPEETLVVEDAASGVDAALRAGMRVVGVGPVDRVGHAHQRVPSTADLDFAEICA